MKSNASLLSFTLAGALFGSVIAGCAVGPTFKRPAPPTAADYGDASRRTETPATDVPGGASQRFTPGGDIPAEWWSLFQSPALNQLIAKALKANADIKAANAALRQAHELYLAQRSTLWPAAQGSFQATRAQVASSSIANPTVSPTSTYGLYTGQLSIAYAPDVFGGGRRAVEASRAQAESSRFQFEATYLTLTSTVVVTAVQEASLRDQIQATERLLQVQHELTEKVKGQRTLGTASTLDLLTQQAAEAQTAATLPPLRKQLNQTRDALKALLGELPSEETSETSDEFSLQGLTLPADLPVSIPSKLVEQRPDIRQAEANLHVASAEAGVALADMLPQLLITADMGSSGLSIGNLLKAGSGFWDVGASLTQTLFDAGALIHRHRAAEAALDQAGAQYRSTVIVAFQNVADTLHALQADADAVRAYTEAERAAKTAFELARQQHEIGVIGFVAVLNAEMLYQQAEVSLVQARASRYTDTAALFQALGGGWWNRDRGSPL